jgi:Holliday junction resolvasome RuvABC endonuclease subunit
MKIMAIDPSLRSTGVAVLDTTANTDTSFLIKTTIEDNSELSRIKRILAISNDVVKIALAENVDIIAIEGLGISAKNGRFGNQFQLAELLGVLKSQILLSVRKVPIIVPPSTWKLAVIGKGNAKKDEIKKCLNKKGIVLESQDQYDALGIAYYIRKKKSAIIEKRGI